MSLKYFPFTLLFSYHISYPFSRKSMCMGPFFLFISFLRYVVFRISLNIAVDQIDITIHDMKQLSLARAQILKLIFIRSMNARKRSVCS